MILCGYKTLFDEDNLTMLLYVFHQAYKKEYSSNMSLNCIFYEYILHLF